VDLRVIRERYRELFGADTAVSRERPELDARLHLDVVRCDGEPAHELTAWATVGLCRLDNGTVLPDGRPLRIELLGVGSRGWTGFAAAFITCSGELSRPGVAARPGAVLRDAFRRVDPTVTTPHALLVEPFSWTDGQLDRLRRDQQGEAVVVAWLQVVPITEAEAALVRDQGVRVLEAALAAAEVPIEDLHRASAA